jgi:hypothetical protein
MLIGEEYSLLLVMTTLEFLDKHGIYLSECCHTQDSIPTKPNTLPQILLLLFNTINEMSSMRPDLAVLT